MLRSVDGWDGEHFGFGEADASPADVPTSVAIENGADGLSATIPDAHLLFTAQFSRAGADLVLQGEDGKAVVVQDYFAADQRARLLSPDGAALSPEIVDALAGPQAPGQFAQAAATAPAAQAVGRVAVVTGDATIVRNGVAMAANAGDPILKGDVLQTVSGTIGVTFADGSTLNLTANTRLVVNEFVYDPRGSANSQLLDLVQGSLTFISGEIAHNGDMRIGTPVATMGIRGTVGGVTTANDGTVNFYVSQSATGAVILDSRGTIIANVVQDGPLIIVRPVGPLQVIAEEVQKSPAQLATELAALQQIVNIQSVGQQIIQQYFQPDPNNPNPNPQSTDKPLTQIQIFTNPNNSTQPGDAGANDAPPPPFNAATITTTTPNPDGTQTTYTETVTFGPNVAPILNYFNLVVAEGGTKVLSATDYSITDPDSSSFTFSVAGVSGGVFQIWSEGSAPNSGFAAFAADQVEGSWTDVTSFTNADIAAGHVRFVHNGGNGAPVFSISVSDGIATTPTATATVNFTPVNDAPVAPPISVTTDENGAPVTINGLANASDPDGDLLHIENAVLTATVPGQAMPQVAYTVNGNSITIDPAQFNELGAGEQAILVANYNVVDSHGASVATSATLIVNGVNDAPVVAQPNSPIMSYTEGQPATSIDAILTLSDVDSASLAGATVSIGAGFHPGEDVLGFTAQNGISGSYDAQTGVLTLSGFATVADYQAALRSVTYSNTSASPSTDTRTINYQVDDGAVANHASNVATASVMVAVNEAPVLSLTNYVEDRFNSEAYNLNAGSVNWATGWIENENGDYASSPTTGEIQVKADPTVSGGNFRLFLSDDDNESGPADTVQRTADLSGASAATLTFDYRRDVSNGNSGDIVYVWASADGINFTQIGQIDASGNGSSVDSEYQNLSLDISTYISALTTIRFSADDSVDNGDSFYIDNVKIAYSGSETFVEGGSGVPVASVGATIKDVDSTHMQSATITLTNRQVGDVLAVNGALPSGIVASSYNTATGVLTLTGNATLADYQTALHQVEFSNTGDNPGSTDRTVSITVSDGTDISNAATTTIHVTPVNDAPVSTDSANPGTFIEDTDTVIAASTLLANASDPDGDTLTITAVGNSANSGTVTLNGTNITYHPAANFSGSDWFVYTVSDGQTSIQRAATFTVAAVNDAPTVASPVAGGAVFDGSTRIEVVLDEPDTGVSREIIFRTTEGGGLFSVDNGDGSHDRHLVITADGNIYSRVHSTEVLTTTGLDLLDGNTHKLVFTLGSTGTNIYVDDVLVAHGVKTSSNFDWDVQQIIGYSADGDGSFTPNNGPSDYFTGTIESYRGWNTELTSAQALGQVALPSPTHEFDFGAYSNTGDLVDTGSSPAAITVDGSLTLVAGSAAPSLAAVTEDSANPPGARVDALFADKFDDVDAGASLAGVAIAGNVANAATEGVWQYWCTGMQGWSAVGDVSLTGALVLPVDAMLRFVPVGDFNGSPPGLVAHGLDNSYAGSFSDAGGGGEAVRVEISIASRGGTTSISADSVTLGTTVTPVNDAPVLNANGGGLSYTEDQSPAAINSAIAVADVDSANLTGATVAITNNFSASEDVLGFVNQNGITGSYSSAAGVLTLAGIATLAQYQAALASVTYSNTSALSAATRTVSFTVDDGEGANHASNTVTASVTVTPVNDTLTLSAADWAAAGTVDLGGGTNVLNVIANADIFASGTPTVTNVATGNFTGTAGDDTVTLTGLQLDTILIGSGTIDLGGGSGDTINLKSTSADLNTLGVTNASISGVEVFSAAGAGAGVIIDLSGQSEAFTITGSNYADTLTGGAAADTINGSDGNDIITGGAGADTLNGGGGNDQFIVASPGDLAGDIINGGAGDPDQLRLNTAATYDLSTATLSNIDRVTFNQDAAGFVVIVNDAATTTADNNNDTVFGDLRFNAVITLTNGVTIDAHALTAGHSINVAGVPGNGSNMNGADTVTGGAGDDVINGGGGADILTGGLGTDSFYISSVSDLTGKTIEGTLEQNTIDEINLQSAGAYNFSNVTAIGHIDRIVINNTGAGNSVILTDAMVATADFNLDGTLGDMRIASMTTTSAVTINASALSSGSRISTNGDQLGGNDTITGGAGADILEAGAGTDIITGGGGNDILTGGAGADTFVFHTGFGVDTVSDFDETLDYLQFDSSIFSDFDALLAATADSGANAIITFDGSNTVTLNNVLKADLQAHTDHLIFV